MSERAPARVDDFRRYSTEQPPQISERCRYWMKRIADGWTGNARILGLGYDGCAKYFGVYVWEWLNVLSPAIDAKRRGCVVHAGDESKGEPLLSIGWL